MTPSLYAQEVQSLIDFFSKTKLPNDPIKGDRNETILNPHYFVNGHFAYLVGATELQIERDTFLPYLDRLQEFKKFLQGQN